MLKSHLQYSKFYIYVFVVVATMWLCIDKHLLLQLGVLAALARDICIRKFFNFVAVIFATWNVVFKILIYNLPFGF